MATTPPTFTIGSTAEAERPGSSEHTRIARKRPSDPQAASRPITRYFQRKMDEIDLVPASMSPTDSGSSGIDSSDRTSVSPDHNADVTPITSFGSGSAFSCVQRNPQGLLHRGTDSELKRTLASQKSAPVCWRSPYDKIRKQSGVGSLRSDGTLHLIRTSDLQPFQCPLSDSPTPHFWFGASVHT